jgi:hypothetical protein
METVAMKLRWLLPIALLLVTSAYANQGTEFLFQEQKSLGEGWAGFLDIGFLASSLMTLTLAAVLGAAIGFHPNHGQTADTLEEIEAPKIFIMYSVIGAIIGILVVKYGLVVGFVLFGIGGLIRFRTALRSASLTGRVIFVTLIGLSCGLDLPHVAVLATLFSFVLIYVVDTRVTYRIAIQALAADHIVEAAESYRKVLEQRGCRIMSEKKNLTKDRVSFIFKGPRKGARNELEQALDAEIEPRLRGTVDWEVD